jgi:TetR/AcrR family transcriptional regulator
LTLQEPKWRRLPEERPHQIIDAAIEVFGERGLAGARLEDIAKRAGVSKGTIYLYFPNKEALFIEMVRLTIIARIEHEERRFEQQRGSAIEQLEQYISEYWEFMNQPVVRTIARLVISELHQFPELAQFYMDEVVRRKYDLVTRLIQRCVDAGEFRSVEPAVAARLLFALFYAHCVWSGMRDSRPEIARYSDEQVPVQIRDFFFHALRP